MERGSARPRNRFNKLSNGVELPSFFKEKAATKQATAYRPEPC